MVATKSLVSAQQSAGLLRQAVQRTSLARHHMLIKIRGTSHRLTGIVDNKIKPLTGLEQMPAKSFYARGVAQIEPEDFESIAPFVKIRLAGVTGSRVSREARSNNELRAGPQKFDTGLVANLDPPAGEERNPPTQVSQLRSFLEIQGGASRAELVIEMMNGRVVLFADVTILRINHFTKGFVPLNLLLLECFGRNNVRCSKHRPFPQLADPGFREHSLIALYPFGFLQALCGSEKEAALQRIGAVNLATGLEQTNPVFDR